MKNKGEYTWVNGSTLAVVTDIEEQQRTSPNVFHESQTSPIVREEQKMLEDLYRRKGNYIRKSAEWLSP